MATSALTTATASALTSTLPDAPKSAQQSPRNQPNPISTSVAVQTCVIEVSKSLQEGEKFIKWDEVNDYIVMLHDLCKPKSIFESVDCFMIKARKF